MKYFSAVEFLKLYYIKLWNQHDLRIFIKHVSGIRQEVLAVCSVEFAQVCATLAVMLLICPELMDFKTRRISHFKKNLVDLAELELKHARVSTTWSSGVV